MVHRLWQRCCDDLSTRAARDRRSCTPEVVGAEKRKATNEQQKVTKSVRKEKAHREMKSRGRRMREDERAIGRLTRCQSRHGAPITLYSHPIRPFWPDPYLDLDQTLNVAVRDDILSCGITVDRYPREIPFPDISKWGSRFMNNLVASVLNTFGTSGPIQKGMIVLTTTHTAKGMLC